MTAMSRSTVFSAVGLALCLSACGGGGGGGSGIASTPPPPQSPTPTPTPPPGPPPIPAGAIGLQSDQPFAIFSGSAEALAGIDGWAAGPATLAENQVDFTYSAADGRYTISVPGFQTGTLVTTGGGGSTRDGVWLRLQNTANRVTAGASDQLQDLTIFLSWPGDTEDTLVYSSLDSWIGYRTDALGTRILSRGNFAYGIPTAASDVPRTGTAQYLGDIRGLTDDNYDIFGNVSLAFDFGRGSLSGVMTPAISDGWDLHPLGDYRFRDTVYSIGSTNFSGKFDVPGSTADSVFAGSFTGPGAAELIAGFKAPYLNPFSEKWGTMNGVWAATKN